jgi:hypothetical protein
MERRLTMRALSVKQPYAEQILRGTKKKEYRSKPTNIRERVYIYASLRPGDTSEWKKLGKEPGDLPVGVLVGSVEVTDCKKSRSGGYEWHLSKPRRLSRFIAPEKHPQPVWFNPF